MSAAGWCCAATWTSERRCDGSSWWVFCCWAGCGPARWRRWRPSGALTLQPRLRVTGLAAAPVSYEVTIDGSDPSRTVGTLRGGRFSARTFSPSGEQLREYVASSGAVVLDELVAHHYHFLAQRMRSGTVPVIIPRQNRQVMATVSDRGEERVEVAGTTARLYHLVVRPQGLSERHVWVDALGRVVKVEIPDANYVAIRTALPE